MNKIFLDSNILIYLYTSDEQEKIVKINEILDSCEEVLISTQVLFEFSYVMHRKLKIDYIAIEAAIKEFEEAFEIVIITYGSILHAIAIASKYKYSFPDSLIMAVALEHTCDLLLTEDMHNGHIVENALRISNPFNIS